MGEEEISKNRQTPKDQKAILEKLGIKQLNQMQKNAIKAIRVNPEIVLLSPTGTGKTLAFLLPIIDALDPVLQEVQVLILVPSRELAIQIEQVTREMGSGFKTAAVYGGRAGAKDKIDLRHPPAILIGTPGRVADHMQRENISTKYIKTLVLDEFDKSLQIGFEEDMKRIVKALHSLKKKILTSATQKVEIPAFVRMQEPKYLDYLTDFQSSLEIKKVISPTKEKLKTLENLLCHLGPANGIVFCNLKEDILSISHYLDEKEIDHLCFYGGIEQVDRERALIKFRNGTCPLIIGSDLAARGLDIPQMDFIIHYDLPYKKEEFTHRNGRTARMHTDGTAYIIRWKEHGYPDYIGPIEEQILESRKKPPKSPWQTLYITGGRRDKISKGDIAGLFFKQGALSKEELGVIELKTDCTYVAVPRVKADQLIKSLNNSRVKKKKLRISLLE